MSVLGVLIGLMIRPLMVSSKNEKVSQKRSLGSSIESFTGSSPSEQIIVNIWWIKREYVVNV